MKIYFIRLVILRWKISDTTLEISDTTLEISDTTLVLAHGECLF